MTVVDPFISSLNQRIEILMCRSMRFFIGYARDSAMSISRFAFLFHPGKYQASCIVDLGLPGFIQRPCQPVARTYSTARFDPVFRRPQRLASQPNCFDGKWYTGPCIGNSCS